MNPTQLIDYIISKMHAVYKNGGSKYGDLDIFYLDEKLEYISNQLDEHYNGSFKEFIEDLRKNYDVNYELSS